MKTSSSILAAIAMLAVAALSATEVHTDEVPVLDDAHTSNHLATSEPVVDEKTWMPFRALRAMDYPQLGHLDYTHKPRKPTSLDNLTILKNAHRALGQAHVTPAPSTTSIKATPAPAKTGGTNSKATPAATTTKATPYPTTSAHKGASPPANKKPKAPVAPPTKQGKTGKTGVSTTSNAVQQKSRNLGRVEAKQQLPHDHHHDAKQNSKNGLTTEWR